jgi:hypothetical protein
MEENVNMCPCTFVYESYMYIYVQYFICSPIIINNRHIYNTNIFPGILSSPQPHDPPKFMKEKCIYNLDVTGASQYTHEYIVM